MGAALLALTLAASTGAAAVRYQVSFEERAQHRANVEMTVTGASGPVELWMPVWTPGAYELRNWGRNVTPLSAVDASGHALAFTRTGPGSFRVDSSGSSGGVVRLRYRVYAARLTDDGSQLDGAHALLNGSSLFLAVRGQEKGLHEVRLALPMGWRAATALDEDASGWQATGYEALIDAPIECGRFVDTTTHAAGRSYRLVVDGAAALPARLGEDVARIVEAEAHLAGAPPYRRYVIVIHLADEAGRVAALEHQASTSIIVPRRSLVDAEGYDELLYVIAHELFHAWNAKRLRPAEMVPYDLTRPQPSRALWITEGLTEYFAHRALLRAGLWSRGDYLAHVGDEAARALQAARGGGTLEEAAELTWLPPDEAADDWDAYYARGHLVALALDAAMHLASDGKHGLVEALRALLADAGRAGGVLPVDTTALAHAIDAITPGVGAKALGWARSSDEPAQLGEALAAIGLQLATTRATPRTVAGFAAEREGNILRVVAVSDAGPAALAGLRGGDRIVQLDGAAPAARWPDVIARKSAGATLLLAVTRGARTLALRLTLATQADVSCKLVPTAATPAVTRLRDALLTP